MHHVRLLSQNRPGPRMGMGHYERLLLRHLIKIAGGPSGWRFDIVFSGRPGGPALDPERLEPGLGGATYLGFSTDRLATASWPLARAATRLGGGQAGAPDIYHSLALGYPTPAGRPAVYTIHDLPPARFPDEGALAKWAGRAARDARAIFTPSQFAKEEIVGILGVAAERVHVVPNGCEHDIFRPDVAAASDETLAGLGIAGPFLIYVGGFTRRKNVRSLLEAWGLVAREFPDLSLMLVGPADPLRALVAEANGPARVVVVGYLERAALAGVLRASVALVCPSVYEGFGLPPLEAMAVGVPVVAVRAGAVPEVVGESAVLVPDGSPPSLAAGVRTILGDASLSQRLRRSGPERARLFSWDAHAERVLDVYRQVIG